MTLQCPEYIKQAAIAGAPVKFRWSNDIALNLYAAKDQNARLYQAVDLCSFKAQWAIDAALTEWILWRFEGLADLTDGLLRVQAAWAAAIDPAYAKSLAFKLTKGAAIHDTAPVQSCIELALAILGRGHGRYVAGQIYLAEMVVKQGVLARHVNPTPKSFDSWLSEALRRTATVFPRTGEYDRDSEVYDASGEKPVPRQFFDPSFNHTDAAAEQAVWEFLQGLDPQTNPYLRSPDEMRACGFTGTPYQPPVVV
jgi:hypothetical protein